MWIVRQGGKGVVKVTEIEIFHNRFYGISEKGKEVLLGGYDSQEETEFREKA